MVGIVIINFNGEKMVIHCLEELLKLDYPNKKIVFLDNASTDKSVELVQAHFGDEIEIYQTGANLGYSGGAEHAVKLAKQRNWKYLMLMNPDIVFEPDYMTKIIAKMEEDAHIGAIIGKLKQYLFDAHEKTDIIDSAGLLMYRDRRVVDRGQSQKDEGQFDESSQVFGITGAAPLYRVAALEDVEILGEVFDQDFFMYKEDVDISWRLNLFGWKNWYLPLAIAYHGRGTGIYKRDSYKEIAVERSKLSRFQKHHSFRNQHFIQIKNDLWLNFLADSPIVVGKEILFLGFILVRETFLLSSLAEVFKKFSKMLKKRHEIMKRKRLTYREMSKVIALGR